MSGTAESVSELVALEVRPRGVGVVGVIAVSIEQAVAKVLEDAAVEPVGSGLGSEGDDAAAGASPLGSVGRGENLELLNGIDLGDVGDGVVVVQRSVGPTIEEALGGGEFRAIDAEGVGVGLALVVVAGRRAVGGDALGEVDQLQRIADVQGGVLDELALNHVAAIEVIGDQLRCGGCHRDALGLIFRGERHVD